MKRIDSQLNPKVKEWKKLHTKKGRDKAAQFVVEGVHLVEEALQSTIEIDEIVMEETFHIPQQWSMDNVSITVVPEKVMKELSETKTPQGIVAVCKMISTRDTQVNKGQYVLVDAIQDPGNLGTIIRTADSAGVDAVILGEGTVDVYNSKVIRATQGSIFHLPVIKGKLQDWVEQLQKENVTVYGTSLEGGTEFTAVEERDSFALIVGNEGDGVRAELLDVTDQNLYVPIYGQAESLNVAVATGILLYHFKR